MHFSTLVRSCHLVSEMSRQRTGCQRTDLSVKRPGSRVTVTVTVKVIRVRVGLEGFYVSKFYV